jgi:predicted SnoaL-like aldol condensation-catalyzing enzyme
MKKVPAALAIAGLAVASAAVFVSAAANAQSRVTDQQRADMALSLENDVIFGGKVEMIPKLVSANYVEHNIGDHANGIKEYTEVMTKRAEMLAKNPQQFPRMHFKLSDGATLYGPDSVIFIRPAQEVDDPRNPGQKVRRSHFDAFRFEGDKIAEHWD